MKAADYQVGGSHYQNLAIQPEVFIRENHMEYHESAVVKYVTRWRNKGGIQDLEKSRQVIQFRRDNPEWKPLLSKVLPVFNLGGARVRRDLEPLVGMESVDYCAANSLPRLESNVIHNIALWNRTGYRWALDAADKWLLELITSEQGAA